MDDNTPRIAGRIGKGAEPERSLPDRLLQIMEDASCCRAMFWATHPDKAAILARLKTMRAHLDAIGAAIDRENGMTPTNPGDTL